MGSLDAASMGVATPSPNGSGSSVSRGNSRLEQGRHDGGGTPSPMSSGSRQGQAPPDPKVLGMGGFGCVVAPCWQCGSGQWDPSATKVSKFARLWEHSSAAEYAAAAALGRWPDMFVVLQPEASCAMSALPDGLPAKCARLMRSKSGGTDYNLVLPRVQGVSLMEFIATRGHKVTCRELLQGAERVLELFAHLHARGYVHGDGFVRNLMVPDAGGLPAMLLIDFGFFTDGRKKGATVLNAEYAEPEVTAAMLRQIASVTQRLSEDAMQRLGCLHVLRNVHALVMQTPLDAGDAVTDLHSAAAAVYPRALHAAAVQWWDDHLPGVAAGAKRAKPAKRPHVYADAAMAAGPKAAGMQVRYPLLAIEAAIVAGTCVEMLLTCWNASVNRFGPKEGGALLEAVHVLAQGLHLLWAKRATTAAMHAAMSRIARAYVDDGPAPLP